MPDTTLPLYALLREVGLSGVIVDLLPERGAALGSPLEEGDLPPLTLSPDPETEPDLLALGERLPLRQGAVDGVLCGARELAGASEAEAFAAEARRALRPEGVLVVISRSSELPPRLAGHGVGDESPAQLESRLRRHFPHITTFTQSALRGYELRRGGARPRPPEARALDGDEEPPSHHVLLASRRHRRWPDSLALQVPAAPPEEAARRRIDHLESSLAAATGEVARRTVALARLAGETARLRADLVAAEAHRDELDLLASQTEGRAALAEEHQARASRAEARAQAFEERLDRLAQQLVGAQESLGLAEVKLHEAESRAAHAETEKASLDAAVSRAAEAIRRADDLAEEAASLAAETRRTRRIAADAEARAAAAEATQKESGKWARDAEQRLEQAQAALEKLAAERRGWAAERATMEEQLAAEGERADAAERAREALEERTATTVRETARLEGEQAGRLVRVAELEGAAAELRSELEALRRREPGGDGEATVAEDAAQHRERAAELEAELERERRSRAAEIDNLRLHAEARLAQAWELGERLDKATRELGQLRQELDEARSARQEEAAWALVIPEHTLPPEVLPELISVIHQGRKLRSLLARLAAVAVAPPAETTADSAE